MATFRIRPKFEMTTLKTPEQIILLVKDKLRASNHDLHGQAMHDHITIRVNKAQRHYWSPQLNVLMYREPEDITTRMVGVYGPMPNVWTMFTLSYLAIGVLSLFITIIGFSQRSLGNQADILWALPILAGLAVILYLVSQMGQKLGASHTYLIHYFFQDALAEKLPEI